MTKKIIIGLILLVVAGTIGYGAYSDYQRKSKVTQAEADLETAKVNQEKTGIDLVRSVLDVYYTRNGRYPINTDELAESMEDEFRDPLVKIMAQLTEFDYTVRGDGQSYRFTYKDRAGVQQAVEGNYQEDFH